MSIPTRHAPAGKLIAGPAVNSVGPEQLIIQDDNSGLQFLIDTGAQVSIIPATNQDRSNNGKGKPLQAANGSSIDTYGSRNVSLKLGRHIYDARLVIANVNRPLLGADFLRKHDLLVDIRGRRLVHADTFTSTACQVTYTPAIHLAAVDSSANKFRKVLEEFPDILHPVLSSPVAKHGTQHFISTQGPPVFARARRLPPNKLEIARKEFRNMEELGIIRKN